MTWMRLLGLVLAFGLVAGVAHASPERRVALIIGNDAYKGLKPLDNAVNDARAMATELKGLGWETTVKTNAGRREMNGAMADFGEQLAGGAVGLFYYAGHGIEAGGQNFLVPVDAVLEREADLTSEAVDAGRLVQAMKTAKNRLNIVILDACRDNPLKGRSGSRGLAVLPASGAGLFLAYAAGPGEKAEDGAKGANGIFTAELVKALREPGLRIEDVFKKATAGVRARTAGKQVPWVQASIEGDFYFRPPSAGQAVVRSEGGGGSGGADKEAMFWSSIQGSSDPAMYEAYLKQWPNGTFAAIAKAKVASLKGTKVAALVPEDDTSRCRSLLRHQYDSWTVSPVMLENPHLKIHFASIRSSSDVVAKNIADKISGYIDHAVDAVGGEGEPGYCVGFRTDIHGSEDGARCLVKLLGPPFKVGDCSWDGFPYNVWTK